MGFRVFKFFANLCLSSRKSAEQLLPFYAPTNLPITPPPTYHQAYDDTSTALIPFYTIPPPSYAQSTISASSIPQESWNNEQCVTWLVLILHEILSVHIALARSTASRFRGDGKELFEWGVVAWGLLCRFQEGEWIYEYLAGLKEREVVKGEVVRLERAVLRYQMFGGGGEADIY